jgi:hypothetical protein
MQNVAGMGGGVQNFGLGHLHNVPGMAMGGLGGLGTQMNGSRPAPTHVSRIDCKRRWPPVAIDHRR